MVVNALLALDAMQERVFELADIPEVHLCNRRPIVPPVSVFRFCGHAHRVVYAAVPLGGSCAGDDECSMINLVVLGAEFQPMGSQAMVVSSL